MPKFFLKKESIQRGRVVIGGEDAYHIAKVLRMRPGERTEATDGEGTLYKLKLTKIASQLVEGEVVSAGRDRAEPSMQVHLFQSVLKGEKMDWVLQKGTEIGVHSFHPFISQRTVVRKELAAYEKKRARWERIVAEAAKQSGRGQIPSVKPVIMAKELKTACSGTVALVAWEAEKATSLKQYLRSRPELKAVSAVIGPEGGFSADEIMEFTDWGITPVSLGPRIFRAETAGPVLAALLLYEYGEMEPTQPRVTSDDQ